MSPGFDLWFENILPDRKISAPLKTVFMSLDLKKAISAVSQAIRLDYFGKRPDIKGIA
jgi:hypothetical protein